ncbi:hypothetical protein [Polaromonas sp.]
MARYKPQDRNSLLLPVVLFEQILPGIDLVALDVGPYVLGGKKPHQCPDP